MPERVAQKEPEPIDQRQFEELITSISTRFVNLRSHQVDEGILEALERIGRFAGSDRSYVFLYSDDRTSLSNTHEWCETGIERQQDALQNLPPELGPWWMSKLHRLETIHVPRVSEMPPEAWSERKILEAQQVRSTLAVPMAHDGRLVGFLGFDAVRREAAWSEDVVSLLTVISEVFVNALERKQADEALRESEARYRTLFEANPFPLSVHDSETRRFLAVNRAMVSDLGYTRDELLGMNVDDVRIRGNDSSGTQIIRHRRNDGSLAEVELTEYEIQFGGRSARLTIAEDVTERMETLRALRESEERYRTLIEVSPDLIGAHAGGQVVFLNSSGARMLGADSPEQIVGRRVLDFVHPDDREAAAARIRHTLESGQSVPRVEEKLLRLDGTAVEVELSANRFQYHGRPAVLIIARDTSERKRTEEEIKSSLSLLQSTLESTTDAVLVVDVEGRIVSYNRRFVEMWNIPAEALGNGDLERARSAAIDQVSDPEQFLRRVQEIYDDPEGESFDRIELRDGRVIERWSRPQILDGKPVGRVWNLRDVTEQQRAERALRQSEERYRQLFERNLAGVFRNTLDGRVLDCNEACARIFGYRSREELLAQGALDVYFDLEERDQILQKLREKRSLTNVEACMKRKDGSPVWVLETITLLEGKEGEPSILEGTVIDISDRKRAEAALGESEERYRLMAQNSTDMISRHTTDGIYLYASPACRNLLGYEPSELVGTSVYEFFHEDDVDEIRRSYEGITTGEETRTVRYRMRRKDGETVWFETTSRTIRSPETGEVVEVIAVSRDISERKEAEQRIEYQAYHDPLTGLPNRMLFKDRLAVALAHAHRHGSPVGVMFLDLDHFKFVNDTLGHTVGDRLLQGVAERLRSALREEDTVSRMGGDEFTLLLPDLSSEEDGAKIAQKILQAVAEPFQVEEHQLFVTTSIGIALYPQDGDDPDTLLKNADGAMYRAKELGRNNYQLCTQAMNARAAERLSMERDLRLAVDRSEFVVHYQPQVALESGRIVGMEALVRWRHPERGLIQPADFIPIAEDARLIFPIGEWVLREACRQTRQWQERFRAPLRVAVNLSARQFQQRELVRSVRDALEATGFDPRCLQLEITESIAMQNTEWTLSMLDDLKEMGISISLDDFGTGHSSLNYLKRFPIDNVKIDRGFLLDVATEGTDAAIVAAMITMAHGLDLRVIAEGVETREQLDFLKRHGCEEMQGFLFAGPLDGDAMESLLASHQE